MPDIALFGAAGAIGRTVADALRAEGRPYRVVGRHRETLEREFGADPSAEIATWDPDDAASVRRAASGITTIVYLVGVPYDQFSKHPEIMRKTLEGAIAAGVSQMLLVGTVYPYGLPQTTPVREDHPREPHTFKGRMRKIQEDLLLDADARGAIRGTVLRLPDFYGPGITASFLHDAFAAAVSRRRANLVGLIDRPHEFLYVPDAGPVITALSANPGAYGRVWHFAGAGTITQRDFAERIFKAAGAEPKFLVANKLMLRALGMFDPFMRELVEMNYLMSDPVIMDDSAIHGLLGPLHKTSYDEGIRTTLEAQLREKTAV
ncbi:MAG TPA: NAD-dependent epimerase/dehydratase family protein [Candidatus Baltobacteraceae bacterium]|jgi:nucleoside-diphosphate-sugar epimerase|nr:NAD-dependent epimerase/dehydratase family protein [Candidatus Baltobacteraceae bacterium]